MYLHEARRIALFLAITNGLNPRQLVDYAMILVTAGWRLCSCGMHIDLHNDIAQKFRQN